MNWNGTEPWDFAVLGFGGFFSIVWAAGLALTRQGAVHRAGIALVLISGLRLCWEASFLSGAATHAPMLWGSALPLMYCIGPAIFLYYRALTENSRGAMRNAILHFLIVPAAAMPLLWWIFLPESDLVRMLTNLRVQSPGQRLSGDWLLLAWVLGPKISILLYAVLLPFHRAGEVMAAAAALRENIKWFARVLLVYIWLMILLDIFGYLLGNAYMFRMSAWSHSLAAICVYLFSRLEPGALLEFRRALENTRYARSKLTNVDVDAVLTRLQHLMDSEQFYADEDLRLSGLAEACGLSPHQVSEILNEKLGLNFPSFVNKHRVHAAAKMLGEDPDRSILSIAMAVGFNSRSAFNRAFHQFQGTTPSRFRRGAARPS